MDDAIPRGMFVADTLTADLTLYENNLVHSEWATSQQLEGASSGDATRYALPRREPLLVEPEAFCDHVAGRDGQPIASLETGLETVFCAAPLLEDARSGESVRLHTALR